MPFRTPVPGPATPGDDRLADLRTLGEQLPRFMRLVHALKAHQATEGRAALVLLFPLQRLGPLRQSTLAELVHADPSTISRHVSLLVERGLVRREPDPLDGRSSRLVATPEGQALLAQMHRDREALIEAVTSAWSAEDLTRFTELLDRFVQDLTDHLPTLTALAAPPRAPRRTDDPDR